jgi:hypothetical protein
MQPPEIAIAVPSQGARRAPGEGSHNGWQKRRRLSARQQTDGVLRLLRGEALALVSRALGIPAARLTLWREACREAGQAALRKPPLDDHDRALARVRHNLGESTMAMERWREKMGRREPSRP